MAGADSYMASVEMWAGSYAPRNWTYCYGQYIPIADNPALYSLLGITYGGDGRTNFAVPDMRGRVAVGEGQGPGLTYRFPGALGGQEVEVLALAQMPSHTHNAVFTPAGGSTLSASVSIPVKTGLGSGTSDPVGKYFGPSGSTNLYYTDNTAGAVMAPVDVDFTGDTSGGVVTIGPTGGNPSAGGATSPFSIMQPFTVLYFIICTDGLYPPRT